MFRAAIATGARPVAAMARARTRPSVPTRRFAETVKGPWGPGQSTKSAADSAAAEAGAGGGGGGSASSGGAADAPSRDQLWTLFVHSAVPMVGFGIMDNLVMIQAGDLIDNTIGVRFGLATLTAAAFGQIFSDVSGVMFGGVVEDACARAGLKTPTLSAAQRQMPIAKRVIIGGSVVGVIAGCLIGATSLLWLDLEAAERAKRAKELDTIFKEVWSKFGGGLDKDDVIRLPWDKGIVGRAVQSGEMINIKDAYESDWFDQTHDKKTGFRTRSVMALPVKDEDGKIVACVQFINKLTEDGEASVEGFDVNDRKLTEMLGAHISIFMAQCFDD